MSVAKLGKRISVSKRKRQKSDVEKFDLKELNDPNVKEKYQVDNSNSFADLEILDESLILLVLRKVLDKT
jgi:hypothetical protein